MCAQKIARSVPTSGAQKKSTLGSNSRPSRSRVLPDLFPNKIAFVGEVAKRRSLRSMSKKLKMSARKEKKAHDLELAKMKMSARKEKKAHDLELAKMRKENDVRFANLEVSNEKMQSMMTANAHMWGVQYISVAAGEICYRILKKQPTKTFKPSRAFQALEVRRDVLAISQVMGLNTVDFCRMSERLMDFRNASCHFRDLASLSDGVLKCNDLLAREPTLALLPNLQDQVKFLAHFSKICAIFKF